jgi:acetyltransferase-like isoleucine patch superfamily enzyme
MVQGYRTPSGVLLKDTRISNLTEIESKKNLILGDNVFIGHFNFIEASHGVTIEEGCQITNYISILSHSSHVSVRLYGSAYRSTDDPKGYVEGKVHIGKYTFIGPHSTIMPNTTIGKGCIVSAHSLVKGEFADYSIIKGNPAAVVGSTKDLDEQYLKDDPELKAHYEAWSKD